MKCSEKASLFFSYSDLISKHCICIYKGIYDLFYVHGLGQLCKPSLHSCLQENYFPEDQSVDSTHQLRRPTLQLDTKNGYRFLWSRAVSSPSHPLYVVITGQNTLIEDRDLGCWFPGCEGERREEEQKGTSVVGYSCSLATTHRILAARVDTWSEDIPVEEIKGPLLLPSPQWTQPPCLTRFSAAAEHLLSHLHPVPFFPGFTAVCLPVCLLGELCPQTPHALHQLLHVYLFGSVGIRTFHFIYLLRPSYQIWLLISGEVWSLEFRHIAILLCCLRWRARVRVRSKVPPGPTNKSSTLHNHCQQPVIQGKSWGCHEGCCNHSLQFLHNAQTLPLSGRSQTKTTILYNSIHVKHSAEKENL